MTTPIPCDTPNCSLPSARIINGALVIESRHRGEVHRCTLSLHYLLKLLTGRDESVLPSALTTPQKTAPP
jgi:hypothetical protein